MYKAVVSCNQGLIRMIHLHQRLFAELSSYEDAMKVYEEDLS